MKEQKRKSRKKRKKVGMELWKITGNKGRRKRKMEEKTEGREKHEEVKRLGAIFINKIFNFIIIYFYRKYSHEHLNKNNSSTCKII